MRRRGRAVEIGADGCERLAVIAVTPLEDWGGAVELVLPEGLVAFGEGLLHQFPVDSSTTLPRSAGAISMRPRRSASNATATI
jgi:hypothetical protein